MRDVITLYLCFIFFFQAEDGIRDLTVTGVQTCALPICPGGGPLPRLGVVRGQPLRVPRALLRRAVRLPGAAVGRGLGSDRKSTRLNSSHSQISYAVFCLKKKKKRIINFFTSINTSIP